MDTNLRAGLSDSTGVSTRRTYRATSNTGRKGQKGGVSVEKATVEKRVPTKGTDRSNKTPTESNIFMRVIQSVPSGLGHLASSIGKAVKEVFLEGLVSYFVFSKAPSVAGSIARATGANVNGMTGVITVTGRKLATKALHGLCNLLPSFTGGSQAPAKGSENSQPSAQDSGKKRLEETRINSDTADSGVDVDVDDEQDLPTSLNKGPVGKKRAPKPKYS